jgi:glycosyltransferase involved in cell wall biosynthesis
MTDRSLINLRHIWPPLYALELLINAALLLFAIFFRQIPSQNVVFNVHGGANLAPLIAARLTGIPVLWIIHETIPAWRFFITAGLRILDGGRFRVGVVAMSTAHVYSLNDVLFLPATVDQKFFSREQVSENELKFCDWLTAIPNRRRPPRLVVVGNLNPLKGVDFLLDSLQDIQVPFHLKVVGPTLVTHRKYAESLRRRADYVCSQPDKRVDFLGWRDESEVRALLASCDVFILPSRSEACPIALLEALAMGCRIVAADVGDVSKMVEKCPVVSLFEAGSVEGCRRALKEMLNVASISAGYSQRHCISSTWHLESVVASTATAYERLLADAR